MRYSKLSTRRTGFGRGAARRPRRENEWIALSATTMNVTSGSSNSTQLLAFEAPSLVAGTPLTADPPQDRIIQRIVMYLEWTSNAAVDISCGLILTDRTWTPTGTVTITNDLDKRWLWWRVFRPVAGQILTPTSYTGASTVDQPNPMPSERDPTFVDISPKVRIEDGKNLLFVIYEGGAATVTCRAMVTRILLSSAGRR